jgi:hypothetical protein
MKKIIITILVLIFLALPRVANATTSQITVLHNGQVVNGEKIFDYGDMKPGDDVSEDIVVNNDSDTPKLISVKCEEVEELKNFSEILELTITTDSTELFSGTLGEFCDLASEDDGFLLTQIPADDSATYSFEVYFPSEAGNEYQNAKYVFNLIFGYITGDHIVINEVYYDVDDEHGKDVQNCCGEVDADIEGNGAFSKNIIKINLSNQCLVVQQNFANLANNIDADPNTGGNTGNSISTGIANLLARIKNRLNYNIAFGPCSKITGNNDEWVEIYNPTDTDVSLQNWKLKDNSGTETIIHANKSVPAFGFALISKSHETWNFWDEDEDAEIIEIGTYIGDGLDNDSDYLFLIRPNGDEEDFVEWGEDHVFWEPAVPDVDEGNSIERLTPGFDTDDYTDWHEQDPPTPGF